MKNKFTAALLTVILLITVLSPVALASVVTGANYLTRFIATNNGSAAVTNEVFTYPLSTAGMIDAGLLNATATDAALRTSGGVDIPFQFGANATYPFVGLVSNLGSYGTADYFLYSEGATGGKYRYFPGAGGMTVADSASLELGDNFTVSISGLLDAAASANKTLIDKPDTFSLFVSPDVSGNATATISIETVPDASLLSTGSLNDWTAAQLVDGNIATKGFDPDDSDANAWAKITYTGNVSLTQWAYYTTDADSEAEWNIQYSDNGSGWTTADTLSMTGGAGWHTATWSTVGSHRYWRSLKTNGTSAGTGEITALEVVGIATSVTATGVATGERTIEVGVDKW